MKFYQSVVGDTNKVLQLSNNLEHAMLYANCKLFETSIKELHTLIEQMERKINE